MTKRVLIIGGYGHFGGIIAARLAKDANITLIIAGRSLEKAQKFVAGLKPAVPAEAAQLDITDDFHEELETIKPDIVVHTVGPFQMQDYRVVETCIRQGCHYIDLADARMFVASINQFDERAKEQNILAVSGASSVPCLTAAIADEAMRNRFSSIEKIDYGISAAAVAVQGTATTAAILSYTGEPFFTLRNGADKKVYGWQGMHTHKYPELGVRFFGNCDVPDLELFPERYKGLQTLRFGAGHEIAFLHIGLWLLSWVVRTGLILPLDNIAPLLMKIAKTFESLGKKRSGFHMLMYGKGKKGEARAEAFYMIAKSGHGVHIPCIPAILLVKGLVSGALLARGARPCLDLINLDLYCNSLKGLDIRIMRNVPLAAQKSGAKAPAKKAPAPAAKLQAQAKPQPKPQPQAQPDVPDGRTGNEAAVSLMSDELPEGAYSYKKDSSVPAFPDDKPLFVFDGVCGLCSRTVKWLARKVKEGEIRFATAQSPLGQALYRHYGLEMDDSFLLIKDGVLYTKSDGYIQMFALVGPPWVFLYGFKDVIPQSLRDKLYDFVAKNRYKWFGKANEECELIPEEVRKNLLG